MMSCKKKKRNGEQIMDKIYSLYRKTNFSS